MAHPHEVLLQELESEFGEVFSKSPQGIYIYLDDPHWICNDRMGTMLGYGSANDFQQSSKGISLLDAAVAPESHRAVVDAYMTAVDSKTASSIPVTWKKKSGATIRTQVFFVPFVFKGVQMVLHFLTPL
jgi:hypothetical protein